MAGSNPKCVKIEVADFMAGADQGFHNGAVDRGAETLIDRVGVDDVDFHAPLITGSISRVPEA